MNKAIEELVQKDLTKKAYEFAVINIHFVAINMLMSADYTLEEAYCRVHNLNYGDKMTGYTEPVFDKAYYSFLKDLSFNSPFSLYSSSFGYAVDYSKYLSKEKIQIDFPAKEKRRKQSYLAEILGTSQGIVFDMMNAQFYCDGFEECIPLTISELKELAQMKNSLYFNYINQKNNELLAQIEKNKNKKGYNIYDIPEIDNEIPIPVTDIINRGVLAKGEEAIIAASCA